MTGQPESQADAEVVEAYRAHLRAMVEGDTAQLEGRTVTDATVYGTRAPGVCSWPSTTP